MPTRGPFRSRAPFLCRHAASRRHGYAALSAPARHNTKIGISRRDPHQRRRPDRQDPRTAALPALPQGPRLAPVLAPHCISLELAKLLTGPTALAPSRKRTSTRRRCRRLRVVRCERPGPGCRDACISLRPAADALDVAQRVARETMTAGRRAGSMKTAADCAGLGQLVELEEEGAELGEPLGAELLRPGCLDVGDGLADDSDRGGA